MPALPEVQAAYRTARAMLSALQLKLEIVSAPSGGPPPPPDTKGGGAAKGGAKGAAAAPVAPDALAASLEPLAPLLQDVSLTPLTRLTALLEAVQVQGRAVTGAGLLQA